MEMNPGPPEWQGPWRPGPYPSTGQMETERGLGSRLDGHPRAGLSPEPCPFSLLWCPGLRLYKRICFPGRALWVPTAPSHRHHLLQARRPELSQPQAPRAHSSSVSWRLPPVPPGRGAGAEHWESAQSGVAGKWDPLGLIPPHLTASDLHRSPPPQAPPRLSSRASGDSPAPSPALLLHEPTSLPPGLTSPTWPGAWFLLLQFWAWPPVSSEVTCRDPRRAPSPPDYCLSLGSWDLRAHLVMLRASIRPGPSQPGSVLGVGVGVGASTRAHSHQPVLYAALAGAVGSSCTRSQALSTARVGCFCRAHLGCTALRSAQVRCQVQYTWKR